MTYVKSIGHDPVSPDAERLLPEHTPIVNKLGTVAVGDSGGNTEEYRYIYDNKANRFAPAGAT